MQTANRFEEALLYAVRLHASQVRKGTAIPYAAHILAVAALVMDHGGNEDEVIAALLHDAIEDQGGARVAQDIRHHFGDRVADLVYACSDTDTLPKPPWRERKEAHLRALPTVPPSVGLITAADKLHNARSTLREYRLAGEALWQRFRGGRDGTLWYLRAATDALRTGCPAALWLELDAVVRALETLANTTAADGE